MGRQPLIDHPGLNICTSFTMKMKQNPVAHVTTISTKVSIKQPCPCQPRAYSIVCLSSSMFAYDFFDIQPSQKAKFLNCYLSQKFNGPPCIYTAIDHKAFTETEG